jgi:hypothetical protein
MTLLYAGEPLTTPESLVAYGCDCALVEGDELDDLIDQASDVIAVVSNMEIAGRRTKSVRPVSNAICYPTSIVARWVGLASGNELAHIALDGVDPVIAEDGIKVDGDILVGGTDYIVQSSDEDIYRYVTRLNSDGNPSSWPSNQRFWRPDTEDNTFSMTFLFGVEASAPGVMKAANEVACWLVNDTASKRKRRLDSKATSASGGGVQLGIRARADQIKAGEIDLPALADLLALYLPGGRHNTEVMSPEMGDGWTFYSQPAAA